MDSISIELPGSEIEGIELEQDRLSIRFSKALLIKTMTGSVERTLWWQKGRLLLGEVEEAPEHLPQGPLTCDGGDVGENIYTYRDMIPLPLQSSGQVFCKLRFRGREEILVVHGRYIRLEMEAVPKYICHLR